MSESTNLTRASLALSGKERSLERADESYPISAASNLPYSYEGEETQGSHLFEYWRVIRKHLWLIIGIALLLPILVAIYEIRLPDVYESQARIQVDLENANPLLGGMSKTGSVILNSEASDPAYFNTQLQILTGPGLLRKVATSLDLEHNPDFITDRSSQRQSKWAALRSLLGFKSKSDPQKPVDVLPVSSSGAAPNIEQDQAEAERLSDYVEALEETIKVEPVKETRLAVRETRLIDISYRHTDPHLAAKIVNTVAQTFVDQNLEKKTATSGSTGTYLQKRIAELQGTIRDKEEQLINYAKNHQILSLDANQNTVVERLEGLNKQLLEAENERKLAEAAYKASLQPGAAEALAEGGGSDREVPSATKVTADAEIKLTELKQKRAELLVENTEKWPAVKEVDKQIAALEKQMSDTRARATKVVTTNLGTRYRQALATEDALRKAYDQQRAETLTQNEAAVNYRILQQEIETNKTLLDGLLQRTKENDVVIAGTPNNIRVVDYAIAEKKPVSPRRTLVVGLSFILALCLGIGLAFLIEYLDDSVRSMEDVENFLRLPSVALIPQVAIGKPKRLLALNTSNKSLVPANANGSGEVLLTEVDKRSPVAEAYRHLRTSILLSTAGKPPKTLLITSSLPSEGKTTTAVNTAISLAQTGANVLIIDADMRRPRVHSIFNLKSDQGLSSLLSRESTETEIMATIQKDLRSGLFVLPAGPVPPNPAELVGSGQMVNLVSAVAKNFTHVIVDSPPIAAFTDGVLIGAMVDAVLLVIHSGKTSRKVVARARKLLRDVGARIIGVVLNKAPTAGANSYYYYSGYYQNYNYGGEQADSQGISA
ncbi:MAG TPA: polysaccharide biosynthesis tyrosine autokinase [Pyrinomonadaceae bacterium]|jgi:capsular exopolysaccharide synthesis family protein|nr:polysaccharide biosynthesis tyrosine autokinase [Pyrinomonadaceae bacterium]